MSLTQFNQSDIVSVKLDTANAQFNISTSAVAGSSGLWVFVADSTTAGYLFKPDTSSLSASNIPSSAAFRHIANYFFGTSTYIIDSFDKATQRTAIRVIQGGRPLLDEGLYPNTVTATISGTQFSLTAIDQVNTSSANSPLGLTGTMIDASTYSQAVKNVVGSIFYDHGIVVFHGGSGSVGSIITNSASGFSLSGSYIPSQICCQSFVGQARNIVKRTIYFCRAFNSEYNYTTNPTARTSDGRIISNLTGNPTTFITTIGLYDNDGNLLAVGKVNPAKRKDQYNESLFKVQLDF